MALIPLALGFFMVVISAVMTFLGSVLGAPAVVIAMLFLGAVLFWLGLPWRWHLGILIPGALGSAFGASMQLEPAALSWPIVSGLGVAAYLIGIAMSLAEEWLSRRRAG